MGMSSGGTENLHKASCRKPPNDILYGTLMSHKRTDGSFRPIYVRKLPLLFKCLRLFRKADVNRVIPSLTKKGLRDRV